MATISRIRDNQRSTLVPARRHRIAVLLGSVLALGVAAPAAAAPWATAQRTGVPSGSQLGGARIAFGGDGTALIDWAVAEEGPSSTVRSGVLHRRADGTFGALKVLPWSIAAAPRVDRNGVATLLGGPATKAWSFDRLGWATAEDGKIGIWHRLTDHRLPIAPSLSANANGDAIAAWVERRGDGVRVRVSLRPAGKTFRPPFTVLDDPKTRADLDGLKIAITTAIGKDGRVAVAYSGRPTNIAKAALRVYAWRGSVNRRLGSRLVVGRHEGYVRLSAAITTKHAVVVAWGSQSGGIEAGSPWVVRAASLAPGAARFGAVQILDPGSKEEFAHSPVIVATGPGSDILVGWATAAFQSGVVRVASGARTPKLSAYQEIAGSGDLTGLFDRADGTALVTWSAFGAPLVSTGGLTGAQGYAVGAAFRPAGARRFSAPESIGTFSIASSGLHFSPRVAAPGFDPVTGKAAIAMVVPDATGSPALEVRVR